MHGMKGNGFVPREAYAHPQKPPPSTRTVPSNTANPVRSTSIGIQRARDASPEISQNPLMCPYRHA